MAKRTVVLLEDDIDGSEAKETLSFTRDGTEYEIELRQTLERFTTVARKISGQSSRQAARKSSSPGARGAKAVWLWAIENGLKVNTRGRIQSDIVENYEAAH
jgi:hypothetical protein